MQGQVRCWTEAIAGSGRVGDPHRSSKPCSGKCPTPTRLTKWTASSIASPPFPRGGISSGYARYRVRMPVEVLHGLASKTIRS